MVMWCLYSRGCSIRTMTLDVFLCEFNLCGHLSILSYRIFYDCIGKSPRTDEFPQGQEQQNPGNVLVILCKCYLCRKILRFRLRWIQFSMAGMPKLIGIGESPRCRSQIRISSCKTRSIWPRKHQQMLGQYQTWIDKPQTAVSLGGCHLRFIWSLFGGTPKDENGANPKKAEEAQPPKRDNDQGHPINFLGWGE